ncbi:D-mannose binding lectin protein with Apple-like carbohydrate-binding domain-containing protein [Actinidia rufa]|uniref:D-mannose binding lectin protein with Apple-like carbohydrate-binding domain-containing protein n=1 Tax=Actinidia rufa TaxID=165716 RepID=A0A7J0F433_9ERIC|nr:D-mannose binding lectin protein with Apple-like carbohydrate-binding domain-containing protein [Actinidia rufa]
MAIRKPINSVTRCLLTQLLYSTVCVLFSATGVRVGATVTRELHRGFTATPDPSISPFQALLGDSTGNYSMGFLRVNRVQLALAVVHVPSSEPLWVANPTRPARWSDQTRVFFNGSLVISDRKTGVFWSTETSGDRVWLSNTSNLQIQKLDDSHSVLWESFSFPSDTLVENQNFTSAMTLVSSNGLYSVRLGPDFIGLYAKFNGEYEPDQIYLRHKALEAKAEVIEGQGPIYIILSSDGYLGMYQNGSVPVDVQSFSTFQQTRSGARWVRIEPDGNLKGYYWTGSDWVLDYEAISDPCELPSPCGSYGLCQPGLGCSCLDNRSDYNSGRCGSPEKDSFSGDFCDANEGKYWVLRRKGVELPYKELMGYEKMDSLAQCEKSCEENCTCWGAVYSNSSGFCYTIDYPIQTLLGVGDVTKVGYFKVRAGAGKKGLEVGYGVGIGFLCGAVLVFGVVVGFGLYRVRSRKRGVGGYMDEDNGVVVGPYKNLGSASFRSIELCER